MNTIVLRGNRRRSRGLSGILSLLLGGCRGLVLRRRSSSRSSSTSSSILVVVRILFGKHGRYNGWMIIIRVHLIRLFLRSTSSTCRLLLDGRKGRTVCSQSADEPGDLVGFHDGSVVFVGVVVVVVVVVVIANSAGHRGRRMPHLVGLLDAAVRELVFHHDEGWNVM
jgi:hypothetical protein